ncbi:MAG: hypothetical protein GWP63_19120 [Haliea sp.]|jgi:hypothetical protein|nr:hypothetical protein [Haliea sp.]
MNRISHIALSLLTTLLFNIAVADTEEKDAETQRFETELRNRSQMMRYPLKDEVIASQVYIFQVSSPESRQALWKELEKSTVQQTEQKQQEIEDQQSLQNIPTDELDAETLRYKAAVEQMNLPPAVVEDLVKMFQANEAPIREMLWQQIPGAQL